MEYTHLTSAAWLFTIVVGPMQFICVLSFFLLRRHPVFAIRVPMVVLVCMILKMLSFFCIAWLFVDFGCPCIISTLMLWLEFTAVCISVMRKVVLLFRYEIQAALDQSKDMSAKMFDENNFFVRYREVLRPRVQFLLMGLCSIWVALPQIVLASVYSDLASVPCTDAIVADNKLVLSTVATAFLSVTPLLVISPLTTRRLKAFPHDSWKMGVESTAQSIVAFLYALVCFVVLIAVPSFEGFLFLWFIFSIISQSLTFVIPLHLKREMVRQLAGLDIEKLTSLKRLLEDQEFLASFDAFLKKEFSSENLFFWLEVTKLQASFSAMFSDKDEMNSQSSLSESAAVAEALPVSLRTAAQDCLILGRQCIGDKAPRQINVSGFTGDDIKKALEDMTQLLAKPETEQVNQQLKLALEEALKGFTEAQTEVYESLRKDSYPRFLLSTAAKKLNQNENFKRLLAAERLEGDLRKTNTDTKESSKSSASDQPPPTQKSNSRRSYDVQLPRLTLGAPAMSDPVSRGSSVGGSTGGLEKESHEGPELEVAVAS